MNQSNLLDRNADILSPENESKVRAMAMYQLRNIQGHIQVYDWKGNFLFSADSEREAREELKDYAESAA